MHLDAQALNDIENHGIVVIPDCRMIIFLEMQEGTETELIRRCDRHTAQRIDNTLGDTDVDSRADIRLALDRHKSSEEGDKS